MPENAPPITASQLHVLANLKRVVVRLKGRIMFYTLDGKNCRLQVNSLRARGFIEKGRSAKPVATALGQVTRGSALFGQRVLVADDDYYFAQDTANVLRAAGADIVGPCSNAEDARACLDWRTSAVVLDINLGDGPCFQLAGYLKERGIPFVFVTGYDLNMIPAEFDRVERLQKPIQFRRIVDAVSRTIAKAA
jgi:hypothetical protein